METSRYSPTNDDRIVLLARCAAVFLAAVIAVSAGCHRYETRSAPELPARFEADLRPVRAGEASGSATITKTDSSLEVRIDVAGLLPDTAYGPNLMKASCSATGASAGGLHQGPSPHTDETGRLDYTDTLHTGPSPMDQFTVALWGPGDQLAACGRLRLVRQ